MLTHPVHTVPAFLPWHRYFLRLYEAELRTCGYTGPMLYWDFVHDSASPATSPIWDPVTGFGGNGAEPNVKYGPRVVDGPFKDWQPLFWGPMPSRHGLARNWIPRSGPDNPEMSGADYSREVMEGVFEETATFDGFRKRLEQAHDAVHGGVGGGMAGMVGGPGDLSGNSASPNGEWCGLDVLLLLLMLTVGQIRSFLCFMGGWIGCGGCGRRRGRGGRPCTMGLIRVNSRWGWMMCCLCWGWRRMGGWGTISMRIVRSCAIHTSR